VALIEGGIMIAKVTGKVQFKKSIIEAVEHMIKALG
jgi:hypothetical protein